MFKKSFLAFSGIVFFGCAFSLKASDDSYNLALNFPLSPSPKNTHFSWHSPVCEPSVDQESYSIKKFTLPPSTVVKKVKMKNDIRSQASRRLKIIQYLAIIGCLDLEDSWSHDPQIQ